MKKKKVLLLTTTMSLALFSAAAIIFTNKKTNKISAEGDLDIVERTVEFGPTNVILVNV